MAGIVPKMHSNVGGEQPNILVIVMDCVRASDFPVVEPHGSNPEFLRSLRQEVVSFPLAASTASWTLPSHASIFTGLYPWDHGCHGMGTLRLDEGIPRFPARLRELGYRTFSASANPIIGDEYGLIGGFDRSVWGEWWERAFPFRSQAPHVGPVPGLIGEAPAPTRTGTHRLIRTIYTAGKRLPATLVVANALIRKIWRPFGTNPYTPNAWLEPTLCEWLGVQPPNQPVFCFVNLMDAHEPYLTDVDGAGGMRNWWRCMRTPQDSLTFLSGPSSVSRDAFDRLRSLYRTAICRMSSRIEQIVTMFKESGRWDNTLLVLTSDHGQAFGEHGMIWHGIRVDEPELRVPLWVRFPRGEHAGEEGVGWASPMDISATAYSALGLEREAPAHSYPLQLLTYAARPEPLCAAGDGASWNRPLCRFLSRERLGELDQVYGVAYQGNRKVIANVSTGTTSAFNIEADPGETDDLWPVEREALGDLASRARDAGLAILHPAAPPQGASGVDDRLRSWGYV
jgi:arylsulfatase A-like enzyme